MSIFSANNFFAIVPAAGIGTRMQADKPKQYLPLLGKSVLEHTLQQLADYPRIKKVVVIINPNDFYWETLKFSFKDKILLATGGNLRIFSVLNGLLKLQNIAKTGDWILVHDAVRPCIQHADIDKLITNLQDHAVGGLLATPVKDTLKHIDANGMLKTIDRHNLWQALTPQMFRYGKLLEAIKNAIDQQKMVTDDASALELIGEVPKLIEGRADNIKITYPEDLVLAEKILESRSQACTLDSVPSM